MVSVYLDTRWADEHQRDRVRVFLKNELRRARQPADQALAGDLDWIEHQGRLLVEQAGAPEAPGVALFACRTLGLREVLPVRVPFANALVVADAPWLRPFAAVLEEAQPALAAFVDGESARLVPLEPQGPGDELVLEHQVEGRHATGGWAALAQSRYQRHIQAHRDQHFEAVADVLGDLVRGLGITRIILAGEPRTVAVFRRRLPPALDALVARVISGTRREPAGTLAARAADELARLEQSKTMAEVDTVLGDAAAGARAVAGLADTLEAVRRNNVHRLYLLRDFQASGRRCRACDTLEAGRDGACPACGGSTQAVELAGVMVDRVIAAGGTAEAVDTHAGLARAGRVAARLRY